MEFRAVFGNHQEDVPELLAQKVTNGRIANAVRSPAKWLGSATRNNVYRIGKAFGFKFKPWGAVKLAGKLGRVGSVLAVVGVGLDIADAVVDERRHRRLEEQRQEIARFLRESVARVVETIAYGSKGEPGIIRSLETIIASLKDVAHDQSSKRDNLTARMDEARRKLAIYAELMSDASSRLGNPWEVQ